ncbi:MAG: hypothetical protein RR278_05905 [Mucinivorans sp.]
MKTINKMLWALLLSLVVGCTKEPVGDRIVSPDGGYNLAINVDPRATGDVADKESEIATVRVIVIAREGKFAERTTLNQLLTKNELVATNVARVWVRSGRSDVYLVINEPSTSTTELSSIASRDDFLKAKITFADAQVGTVNIPMFQRFANVNILPYPAVTKLVPTTGGEAKRMWAKVRVRFRAASAEFTNLTINSVALGTRTTHIYLQDQDNKAGLAKSTSKVTQDYQITDAAINSSSSAYAYEFYVPEFIGASAAKDLHSYLEVTATVKPSGSVRSYILPLGDDLKFTPPVYDLYRNNIYDIVATIKGYGDGKVDIQTSVLAWTPVNSASTEGGYLSYVKTTNGDGTDLADGGQIKAAGETISVTCKTNIGGWNVVTQDKNGLVINRSAATPALTTMGDQSVAIPLPAVGGVSEQFTVSIFKATQTVAPIKILTYSQIKP